MRPPTSDERAKEVSFFYTSLGDIGIVALIVIVAVGSGSLTMFSEAVRGVLLLTVQLYSLWVLFAVHRDRLSRYQYGVGKIEQFVWVVVGLSFVIGALWVAHSVIASLLSPAPAASPLGLALAAVANAINLVINGLGWHAMRVAARDDTSGVFGAQLSARRGLLVASLVLQITLTAAALAKDPQIALVLDALGAAMVVFLKLRRGILMIARGLPDLLDAPAADDVAGVIRSALASLLPEPAVRSIRTRRAGRQSFAEVTVLETAFGSQAWAAAPRGSTRRSARTAPPSTSCSCSRRIARSHRTPRPPRRATMTKPRRPPNDPPAAAAIEA